MNILKGFLDGLRPEPRLTVSEWADKHRHLSSKASASPGRWQTSRFPFLKAIMDDLSVTSAIQEVIVMKGVQLGFSECGFNLVGYAMDVAPGPILYVLPTKGMCEQNSKTRIAPMIEASPRLREKVPVGGGRDSGNTVMSKQFPGGHLTFAGGESAAGLRNMPIRFLILDEVDAYPKDVDGEGSPVALAVKRTNNFPNKKIFKLSSPTIAGMSVIEDEFETTDQNYYNVPCPHCGAYQVLRFGNLIWEAGKPETVKYRCEHCAELIEERFKTAMLRDGEFRPEKPENVSHRRRGYHVSSLYSPFGFYSWEQAASEWEDAQGDDNKMKTFINTVLGETYSESSEFPDYIRLYNNNRDEYAEDSVPDDVSILTAGVDIQKDRIEVEVVGWAAGRRSYSIMYSVLLGDTAADDVWCKLTEVLDRSYIRSNGAGMKIQMMCIDTGYNTQKVYDYCKNVGSSAVIPVKGSSTLSTAISTPRAVYLQRDGRKAGSLMLYHVGSSFLKTETYGFLKLDRNEDGTVPAGFCTFPQYDEYYFKMLTAERLQMVKDKKGYSKTEWIKHFERNEALDCRVYARAGASIVGVDRWSDDDFHAVKMQYVENEAPVEIVKKKKKKSS